MSNKPIVPVFKAERLQTSEWYTPVNVVDVSTISNGDVVKRESIIEPRIDCYKVDNSTLKISLDNGTNWHSMEQIKEALELRKDWLNNVGIVSEIYLKNKGKLNDQ